MKTTKALLTLLAFAMGASTVDALVGGFTTMHGGVLLLCTEAVALLLWLRP